MKNKKEKISYIPAAKFHIFTKFYGILCSLFGLGEEYRRAVIEKLGMLGVPNKAFRVLDAGCGPGQIAVTLKKSKPKVNICGIDADSEILSMAKEKSGKLGIKFQQAYLQKLPYPDNYFDVVYSSLVFHHLKTKEKNEAILEIYRVLKPKGKFLLADFGKPKNLFPLGSWFSVIFEEGHDNYKGNLPKMVSEAKFKSVKAIGEYKHNISFLLASK